MVLLVLFLMKGKRMLQTTSNILFQVSPRARRWSDEEVYSMLGQPGTGRIETLDNSPPGPHAPRELVQPVDKCNITSPSFLEENIVVTDFGLHVIKVTDRTQAETTTFDSVKDSVREVIAQDLEKLLMTMSRSSGSAMSRMVGALDKPKARRL